MNTERLLFVALAALIPAKAVAGGFVENYAA